MIYNSYEPHQDLIGLVKCYWSLESTAELVMEKQIIVPDGCMEMIFHHGDLFRQYTDSVGSFIQPRCFVMGQLTRPLEIEPTGRTEIFSVRFHPDGFVPFASMPLKEMENKPVGLDVLFGNEGNALEQKVLSASDESEKINAVEIFLLNNLSKKETVDRVVKSTVETIFELGGKLGIDEISKRKKISRRQLERKFSLAIGLSPKQLSKMVRMQSTLKILKSKKFTSLTALAYEAEYYDQAHFIKDFNEFTGFSPKEFYGNEFKMTSLFISN